MEAVHISEEAGIKESVHLSIQLNETHVETKGAYCGRETRDSCVEINKVKSAEGIKKSDCEEFTMKERFKWKELSWSEMRFHRQGRRPRKQKRKKLPEKRKKGRSRYKKKSLYAKQKKQRRRFRNYSDKRQGIQGTSFVTIRLKVGGTKQRQQLWKEDRSGNLGSIGEGDLDSHSADSEDDDTYVFGDLRNGLDWNYLTDWEHDLDDKNVILEVMVLSEV